MPEFNNEQKAAICARNPFLLCSAGAGSGKTTVMVESIVQKLAENPDKDISGFLVITFTNEAAGNMKRKIQQRLAALARENMRTSQNSNSFAAQAREKMRASQNSNSFAAQARENTRSSQGRNSFAARALGNLENASISTIHAFCKNLISSYFYAIEGMPPRFEILEEAKLEQLFQEACESALDDICEPGQTLWPAEEVALVKELMLCFSQADLLPMLRTLYKALMGIPDPFDHLDQYLDAISTSPDENPWAQEILFAARMDLDSLENFLLQEKEMMCSITPLPCEEAAEADESIIRALIDKFHEPLSIQERISAVLSAQAAMPKVTLRKPGEEVKAWYENFKELRGSVKGSKGILDKTARNLQLLLSENQIRDNLKVQRLLKGMAVLLKAASGHFRSRKLEESGIDYSDMEQMAYELVCRDEIREALTETITDIYVDECQDVSAIQYAIIHALTGGSGRSICRVGDIKQSIYGFRSAAPDLMERDIQAYSSDPEASHRKIFFQQNYRSCRQIIDCINQVFDTSMEKSISQIDYTPEDHLKANIDGEFGPVEVILLAQDAVNTAQPEDTKQDLPETQRQNTEQDLPEAQRQGSGQITAGSQHNTSAPNMLEAECEAAGRRIEAMVSSGERDYKDIVILVQNARTDAPIMVEHFRRMHIPVLYDGGVTFYGLTEISSFLSLLSVIDNDHTDVELVGTLRGVPFYFSDTDLAQIREAKTGQSWFYEAFRFCCDRNQTDLDQRCRAANTQIHAWREYARTVGVSDFIWHLMRESGMYAVRGAYPDGKLRQLNLDTLYQQAVDMERRGITRLSGFLREIGQLRAGSRETGDSPAALGEGDNLVRLMTMHKSKGLEFPVVILMNLQKNLRKSREETKIKIDVGTGETGTNPLGVYVPVISLKKHTKRDTYGREAFRIRGVRTSIAEDTRLLYVAMTRAMHKLILIGSYKEKEAALWTEKMKVPRIWKTRSMLDLIMPAVLSHMELPEPGSAADGGGWHLSVQLPSAISDYEEHVPAGLLDQAIAGVLSQNLAAPESMWTAREPKGAPLKTSVTSLLRSGIRITLPESTSDQAAKAAVRIDPEKGQIRISAQTEEAVPQNDPETAQTRISAQTEEAVPQNDLETAQICMSAQAEEATLQNDPENTQTYMPQEEEETVEVKRRDELPGFLLGQTPPRPAFLEEEKAGAADIGSITHRFLRLIDLEPFRNLPDAASPEEYLEQVSIQLARMKERSILTEREADAVYAKGAAAFLQSSLGRRAARAVTLEREWPFTMQIRPNSPTMVQGIVDAAFLENGQWILIDYKTDRDTRPGHFVPRHEMQMNWYRTAVERLTGIPVKEMWLFALRAGKSYPVRTIPV